MTLIEKIFKSPSVDIELTGDDVALWRGIKGIMGIDSVLFSVILGMDLYGKFLSYTVPESSMVVIMYILITYFGNYTHNVIIEGMRLGRFIKHELIDKVFWLRVVLLTITGYVFVTHSL